jgi:hypothetical protein
MKVKNSVMASSHLSPFEEQALANGDNMTVEVEK